jgi:hypothetical protein
MNGIIYRKVAKQNIKLREVNVMADSAIIKSSVFWDIMPWSLLKPIDVSEEQFASIFRAEE